MIVKFTDRIWFGDKPSIEEGRNEIKSVINVAHNLKQPYWNNVGKLPWDVWYFRLASPDRAELPYNYITALAGVVNGIAAGAKFPLLCHCRMGGHRGPTAALFASWVLDSSRSVEHWIEKMQKYEPGFLEKPERRVYRSQILKYCRDIERNG